MHKHLLPPVNERWVLLRVASAFGSAPPPPPPLVADDTNAHLIGLVPGDKDRLGRVFIEPDGSTWHPASKEVNKAVRESVRRLFSQPWHSWSEIPEDHRQAMFEEFKRNVGAKLRNWLERVRRTDNVAQWILKDVYDDLCIYWESPEYNALSEQNKKARASLKGGSLHTGGAKSVGVIVREMEEDLGSEPTQLEVFRRTHLKKKTDESDPNVWVEPRDENANNEYIRYLSEFGSTEPTQEESNKI